MDDIHELYKEKILYALSDICVQAYKEGVNRGLKVGMELKEQRDGKQEPFDYDDEKAQINGMNDSKYEFNSQLNKDLGILGDS